MKFKKLLMSILAGAFVITCFVSCSNDDTANNNPDAKTVGISMPTKSLERWNHDGNNLKRYFKEKGYNVKLTYADNKIDQQVKDIESLLPDVDILLVSPVDNFSLAQVLKDAKRDNKPIVAYDKLVMNNDTINYYVSFDNFKVGAFQAQYIVDKLGLKDENDTSKTYNMEIITGEPTDNNALQFFNGQMSVLKKYMDTGVIKVPSGQTEFSQCTSKNWDGTVAMTRMQNILASTYGNGEQLDIVLCSNDAVALGALQAIGSDYQGPNKDKIIITGQDGDEANLKNICDGKQSMTIYKPIVNEATVAVAVCDQILNGKNPDEAIIKQNNWNFEVFYNTESYDNGAKNVPSYLLTPTAVTKDNMQQTLIDKGFFSWGEDGYPKVVNN